MLDFIIIKFPFITPFIFIPLVVLKFLRQSITIMNLK